MTDTTADAAPVDLRSDTVTRPDPEMRRAMAAAEVGDDVFREDPTVRALEERAAELLGKEAALFLPTGTMGNQVALHVLGRPGGEVVGEAGCHVFHYEMGGLAALSGMMPRPVPGTAGILDPQVVEAAVRPAADYLSRTVLLVVENTHNMAGGTVTPPERLRELLAVAARHRLPVHLDGARLGNAAVALGVPPAALADGFTTVMTSLSKGLGCPVGSLLAGTADVVAEARRVRKMFGGGMRQAGILAAAGLLALSRGFDHLAADHANARLLAEGLATLPGVAIDPAVVATNIVIFHVAAAGDPAPAGAFVRRAADAGVLGVPIGPDRVRFVTHRDAPRSAVALAVQRLQRAFAP